MLAIRLQRTGRKGYAQYRVIVQDARRTPTSGKVVASIGNFNPHTKEATLDTEKATYYLKNGAQPSDRVARLLSDNGVKLPDWVSLVGEKKRSTRNPEKLRRNQPEEIKEEKAASEDTAAEAEEAPTEEVAAEATEAPAEEA